MGASGVKLFDDDLAQDLRDEFRELLQHGNTVVESNDAIIENNRDLAGTPEESVFWLALAAIEWEYGSLQAEPLARALRIIEQGVELERWDHDPRLKSHRKKVLESLAVQLQAPKSKPKPIPRIKRHHPTCSWSAGDVIAYHSSAGQYILLRVVSVIQETWNVRPICELLDWVGTEVPGVDAISQLPIRRNQRYPSESIFGFPMVNKHLKRSRHLGIQLSPTQRDDGSWIFLPIDFDALPSQLLEYFGLVISPANEGAAKPHPA